MRVKGRQHTSISRSASVRNLKRRVTTEGKRDGIYASKITSLSLSEGLRVPASTEFGIGGLLAVTNILLFPLQVLVSCIGGRSQNTPQQLMPSVGSELS